MLTQVGRRFHARVGGNLAKDVERTGGVRPRVVEEAHAVVNKSGYHIPVVQVGDGTSLAHVSPGGQFSHA